MSTRRKTALAPPQGVEPMCVEMPREYSGHALSKQMRLLMEEEALQDTLVLFSKGETSRRMSGCLLSLLSPVLHKMVCGAFKECLSKRLELGDIEEGAFMRVVGLACGEATMPMATVRQVLELCKVADRLQMSEVVEALMATACRSLSVDVCAEVLSASTAFGFTDSTARCRCLALERFEEVGRTGGFMELDEESVGGLVDDDELAAESEEGVLEVVVKWMKGGGDELRGEGLLRKVRYGLMGDEYLSGAAAAVLGESEVLRELVSGAAAAVLGESEVLRELVSEAIRVKRTARERPGKVAMGKLGGRALLERRGKGVSWERCKEDGERRLEGRGSVFGIAECMGRVCCGSEDGSIRVRIKSTLAEERVLKVEGASRVWSLTCWEGHLVSGHADGRMMMWDVVSGRCKQSWMGHADLILALAVCGERLLSGSFDKTLKVWRVGEDMEWRCERTLAGQQESLDCLAVWEGKVMGGSSNSRIYVWDVESGAREATLEGHTKDVMALVMVAGVRLISGSLDGTIRLWGVGTWLLLQTVEVYTGSWPQGVCCLAVSGSKLVMGSNRSELRVWDLDSLECEHKIQLHIKHGPMLSILAMSGEVWAGAGKEVVVWGRE